MEGPGAAGQCKRTCFHYNTRPRQHTTVVPCNAHCTVHPITILKRFTTAPASLHVQAPVSGSKKPAIDGQLIILAAGDEALFKECEAAFSAMVSWQHVTAQRLAFAAASHAAASICFAATGSPGTTWDWQHLV